MDNEEKIMDLLGILVSEVAEIKTDLADVKTDLAGVKTDLADVKTDLADVKTDLAETKQTVARIEVEHGRKLDALADGYQANREAIEEIRDDVAAIKEALENQDIRVSLLETKRR